MALMGLNYLDPLAGILRKHAAIVRLGSGPDGETPEARGAALRLDLEHARQRSSTRFGLILGVLAASFLAALAVAALVEPKVSSSWLVGLTGLSGGGFGACLLQLNRSWWRTDTLLTVAKYASPAEMSMILNTLLVAETGSQRLPAARSRQTGEVRPRDDAP
jgi:hypothetical protein